MLKVEKNILYSTINIENNKPILEFTGNIFNEPREDTYQIGTNKFLGNSGEIDDYVSHSCSPNCRIYVVGSRAWLYSIREIKVNEKISFDYSTIISDDTSFNCVCEEYNCRKKISKYDDLDDELKKEYLKIGAIPDFMRKK